MTGMSRTLIARYVTPWKYKRERELLQRVAELRARDGDNCLRCRRPIRFDLPPGVKLAGQVVAAVIPVASGVEVSNITLPFLGALELGDAGAPITVVGLVLIMNVVNFSDGIDGLAAGVCAISGVAFSIIAFDLGADAAGTLGLTDTELDRISAARLQIGNATSGTISITPRWFGSPVSAFVR